MIVTALINLPKNIALFAIRLYQRTISPDHGVFRARFPYGYCQFHPTCSQYGYEAIERFGVVKGAVLAGRRLLRCHPWSKGGVDPVSPITSSQH